jgi:hypothetical protein
MTAAVKPLSAEEEKQLSDLMVRASAGKAPSVRVGEPYIALINLSVPRRGDKDHATDLVMAGETVHLTDEEAAAFNRHGNRDGRQIEVVRKVKEGDQGMAGRVHPRAVSGLIRQPPPPPPGSDQPRPDPEGSSQIQVIEPSGGRVPEAHDPLPGDENHDHADAVDIPPRAARGRRI